VDLHVITIVSDKHSFSMFRAVMRSLGTGQFVWGQKMD
jgi:hypothetical protein